MLQFDCNISELLFLAVELLFFAFAKSTDIAAKLTLGKTERLKSRKAIGQLFEKGKAVTSFPVKMLYTIDSANDELLRAGWTVSTRKFKHAVDRNRVKRLLREVYRLQKNPLQEALTAKGMSMHLFFIYLGNELPAFEELHGKMGWLLKRLSKELEPAQNT